MLKPTSAIIVEQHSKAEGVFKTMHTCTTAVFLNPATSAVHALKQELVEATLQKMPSLTASICSLCCLVQPEYSYFKLRCDKCSRLCATAQIMLSVVMMMVVVVVVVVCKCVCVSFCVRFFCLFFCYWNFSLKGHFQFATDFFLFSFGQNHLKFYFRFIRA